MGKWWCAPRFPDDAVEAQRWTCPESRSDAAEIWTLTLSAMSSCPLRPGPPSASLPEGTCSLFTNLFTSLVQTGTHLA